MKTIKLLAFCAIVVGLVTSCQKEDLTNEVETPNKEVSKEVKLQLEAIGVNPTDAIIQTRTFIDASEVTGVRSGDYFSTIENLMKTPVLGTTKGDTKQYRTNNLVTGSSKTIDVIGYTGNEVLVSIVKKELVYNGL
ncbi:M57 family metalloprotease [Aquimarina amphilecti]|uniref:M57 family metalloprotease n=1 Tax=Aquimarina amphilecti TaxID=1038014 RepID=UPI002698306B